MDLGSAVTKVHYRVDNFNDQQSLQDWAAEKCTACYRAPELFHVEYPTIIDLKAADIWSLGCILYALVFYQGPLDAIWLRGDSLNLAVLSIEKYIKDLNSDFSKTQKELYELAKTCLNYDNQQRVTIDDILKK